MSKGFGVFCAVTFVLAGFLAGCGVVGSGNNNNSGGGTNTGDTGQAQGLYSGTTSSGSFFESLVLPNDKYYEVYGTLIGNLYSVSGIVSGQGISGSGTYTANVNELQYTGQSFIDSLAASDTPGSSFGGTLIQSGKSTGVTFSGTAPPASSFSFNSPAAIADITGSWTGTQLDGTSTTVNINSTAMISGSASGCQYTGTVVPDTSKNFFLVSMQFGGLPCALPNQFATGVAVVSLLPDGVTQQLWWVLLTDSNSQGTAFLAQRPTGGGATTPNALIGQYAFSLTGFDSAGNPMSIAGSVKADGLGHITAGEADVNDNGTISSDNSLAGTYAFDSNVPPAGTYMFNMNGQGTLGTIALTYMVGTVSHPLAFSFSLQSSGTFGEIMSEDINNFVASGTIEQQSSSVFTSSSLVGDYIAGFHGMSAGNSTSVVGRLTLASGGASSNVAMDRSIAGQGTAGPTTGASATVTFGSAGPDGNGRGTFTLTLNDALANTTQSFAYYAVSAKKMVAVEVDGNGTMIADFSEQSTPFTAGTVVTAGSVFGMAGVDPAASGNEIAAVGQLQITGVGATSGAVRWDSNDAGIVVGPASFASQAVPSFDATTGRGTVSIVSGAVNGLADSLVFYVTGPGTGLVMDTTAGTNNRAMAGTLTAQAGGPYTASTDLGGLGIVRGRGTTINNALSLVGLFGLTTSQTTYALAYDQRFLKTGIVQTQSDQSISSITVGSLDQVIGRGTLSLANGSKTATEAFYVVGPNQFVFIDVSPVSSGLNGPSSLFYVDAH
jgi:hypothetical protein